VWLDGQTLQPTTPRSSGHGNELIIEKLVPVLERTKELEYYNSTKSTLVTMVQRISTPSGPGRPALSLALLILLGKIPVHRAREICVK